MVVCLTCHPKTNHPKTKTNNHQTETKSTKMNKKHLLSIIFALSACTLASQAQQLAFPEAQGWGRFATGGRYGTVYHVTNLNDSGTGSLRDAVSGRDRIVVFDVAGVIKINSRMTFAPNLYVAGQTAPGEGITVYGNGVSFSGSSNSIIRYMRFRMGAGGDSGKDCAGIANGTNMIFDHCSFAWGRDETFSINSDGKGEMHSFTLQNCVIGQGLMSHSAGGLMQGDYITLYRNFYCDNTTRNNKVKGRNQYVNNFVYNWKDGAYIMGGDSEGDSYCNIVGNVFVNGPGGGGNAFTGGNEKFRCYVKDNIQDSDKNGLYAPLNVTNFSGSSVQSAPFAYPELETLPSSQVLGLLGTVGASFPFRDYVDCYMVDEARSFGLEGAFIANEGSLPYGIPSTWAVWKGNTRVDTDKDGIPDEWEERIGSDPKKNDAMVIQADGYTHIEHYLNALPNTKLDMEFLRAPQLVSQLKKSTSTMQIGWRDWTENEQGFILELKNAEGEFVEAARTSADATTAMIKGLEPGTAYTIRMRAWGWKNVPDGDIVYSDYTKEQEFKTDPLEVGMVDIYAYEPDATWKNGETNWNTTDQSWNTADGLYKDGMKVLFTPEEDTEVQVTEAVSPACVVIVNEDKMKLSGTEAIAGSTTLNKGGEGELTISKAQNYTGQTVVHEGTLSFSSLKDGGIASGIGASEEFAQNWIFNGGTYRYYGTSTSTNRSARILKESTFTVSSSTATVTLNGTFEGAGNLVIDGKGIVKPTNKNFFTYTGATILKGGTLQLPTPDMSNNGVGASSKLVFAGGTLKTAGETEGYENYTFPMEVREGTTSQFSPNRNCYMKSTVTGSGTLQLNIPYVREYVQGNWDGFTGRLIAYANASGNLFLLSGKNIPNGVVELKNGARCCGWDTSGNYTLGGLAGDTGTQLCGSSKQTNGFTCAWTIGTANTDETFKGVINNYSCSGSGHQGTVSITKAGTGTWRLTGTNEYSGTTTVSGGRLVVNGTNSGAGLVYVNKDAQLAGTGIVTGAVTVKTGGSIYAGDETIVNRNTLNLKAKLTVQRNGIITIPVSYDGTTVKSNRLVIGNGAALTSAILKIQNIDEDKELDLPVGTELKVFTITGTVTGSVAEVQPATPGYGKLWDTTELKTKGIIKVIEDESVGVTSPLAQSSDKMVYTLNGVKLNANDANHGLYILPSTNKKVAVK